MSSVVGLPDTEVREAGSAITNAGGAFHAGLVYSPGRTDETDTLVEQARKLPELGATRVIVNDPTGALVPHRAQELVANGTLDVAPRTRSPWKR